MTIGENLMEPLVNADVIPPPVLTLAGRFMAVPRRLSHDVNSVSCDAEEKSSAWWVWGEVREQCCLAGPIMIMYLLDCGIDTANTVFVGHLGPFALAAFTLGTVFAAMVCFTVQTGMANALETLCGQAYGAQQYHLLGVFLQRAVLVFAATGVPMALLFLNMGRILVALGQDPAIAQAAQSYTYWSLPLIALYGILYPVAKFFQTQHAVVELMASWAVMLVVQVPLCWLTVYKLDLGLKGVAIASNISTATSLAVPFAFIRFSPRFAKTFPSFTWEAFRDVGDFSRLALSSATMLCLDQWVKDALTLMAGLLPNSKLNLSSFAICLALLTTSNMISLALGVASSVRVANKLGAGKAHAARSVVAKSLVTGLVCGAVMASLMYSLREVWGWAFSNDFEVVQHVAHTAPYLAVLAILYASGAVLSGTGKGVVRGIGWQRAGAIANLGAYYVVGLPVAWISLFVFHVDSKGLWLGMGCGLVTQNVALVCIILCPNWDQLAQEAFLRSYSFSAKLSTPSLPLTKPLLVKDDNSPEDQ